MKPYARKLMPTCAVRYSGRTAATISEEMSVSRLTAPSNSTVVAILGAALAATSRPELGRSRTERYMAAQATAFSPPRVDEARPHTPTVQYGGEPARIA